MTSLINDIHSQEYHYEATQEAKASYIDELSASTEETRKKKRKHKPNDPEAQRQILPTPQSQPQPRPQPAEQNLTRPVGTSVSVNAAGYPASTASSLMDAPNNQTYPIVSQALSLF